MSETATWDSQIEASVAEPADTGGEASDTPDVVTPTPEVPVEAPSETPAEGVVEPSDDAEKAGEEKAETDEPEEDDEETNDPPELQALPSKSAQRRQARRERVARLEAESQVVQSFLDPTAPIASVAETLESRSPSRYHELVEDFFENHGPQYLQKKYGLKVEELDAIVERAQANPAPQQSEPGYDPLEDPLVPEHVKDELRDLRGIKDEFGQVKEKVSTFETKEQERERLANEEASRAIETKVFQAVSPVMGEVAAEYGLVLSKDDPPDIAALKKIGVRLLSEDTLSAFMANEENVKARDRVSHWASKREEANALREVDALKVRTRAAAESARQGDELGTVLRLIEQLSKTKAEKISQRGKGQPPVPAGAPPGGSSVPKTEIKTWDDAFAAVGQ